MHRDPQIPAAMTDVNREAMSVPAARVQDSVGNQFARDQQSIFQGPGAIVHVAYSRSEGHRRVHITRDLEGQHIRGEGHQILYYPGCRVGTSAMSRYACQRWIEERPGRLMPPRPFHANPGSRLTVRQSLVADAGPKEHVNMSSMADQARKIPGVAAIENLVNGVVTTEGDLPIVDYDKHTAHEIADSLNEFSQRQLRHINAYERKRQNRTTVTDRIRKLTAAEPFPGYDDLNIEAITHAIDASTVPDAKTIRAHEHGHRNRAALIEAADQRIAAK